MPIGRVEDIRDRTQYLLVGTRTLYEEYPVPYTPYWYVYDHQQVDHHRNKHKYSAVNSIVCVQSFITITVSKGLTGQIFMTPP